MSNFDVPNTILSVKYQYIIHMAAPIQIAIKTPD